MISKAFGGMAVSGTRGQLTGRKRVKRSGLDETEPR
jgi:hypothetical protein